MKKKKRKTAKIIFQTDILNPIIERSRTILQCIVKIPTNTSNETNSSIPERATLPLPESATSLAWKHFTPDRLDRRSPAEALVFGTWNANIGRRPIIWIKNSRQSRIRRGPRTRFNAYNGFHRGHVTQFGSRGTRFKLIHRRITKLSEPVYQCVEQCD